MSSHMFPWLTFTSLQAWRNIFETNFFGSLKMTQALLPHYRSRKTGDIVFIGSIYGLTGQMACVSYSATKFALEGLHDALRMECSSFGIRSFMFEPGICRTEVVKTASQNLDTTPRKEVEELTPMRSFIHAINAVLPGNESGDPKKVVSIIVDIVRGEGVAEGKEIPDRLPLGSDALIAVQPKHENMLKQWGEWKDVILSTDCDDVAERGEPEYLKMLRSVS
jgi:NAD(P)-dependent dehydrogenase (short-subunit alcohol dehydrogenase family)